MNFSLLNFDIGLVLFYLVLTLGVGIYKGRNVTNLKSFAVGDNNFPNTALIATITATWIGGGSTVGIIEEVYNSGIIWFFIFLGAVVEILLFQLFAGRIIKFKGFLSVAEILGAWYGKPARVIGGICAVSLSIGLIGAQIAVIGQVCYEFFNIPPNIGILIAAGIVVLYSTFGGIQSVTVTDIIQLAFFMAAMPIVASVIIDSAGGYKELSQGLPRDHLHIINSYGSLREYFWLFVFFTIPSFDACLIQRTLMAKDKAQIKECFKTTAFIMAMFYALCTIISLSTKLMHPGLDSSKVLYYAINNYLPVGIKGLAIAGLLAVVMSTADSHLNVSSVITIHDVVNPLRKSSLSDRSQLLIARILTFFIGVAAIVMAISFDSILKIMMKSWVIWSPVVVGPLYATFLGVRTNITTFFIGMVSGLSLLAVWLIYDIEAKTGVDSMIPTLLANLAAFTLAAFYYHKFAPEKLNKPVLPNPEMGELLPPKLEPKLWLKALPRKLFSCMPIPGNLLRISTNRVRYFGAQYENFGYFIMASFIVPFFMWSEPSGVTWFSYDIAVTLRFIGILLAFVLVSYDLWEEKYKKYLPLYWHFTLMYSLSFLTSFLFLYNGGSSNWLINVALSLMVLAALTDWLSFIILLVVGAGSGVWVYHYFIDSKTIVAIFNDFDTSFSFVYVVLFSTIIGMLFSRNREVIQQKVTQQLEAAVSERTADLQEAMEALKKSKDDLERANKETREALAVKTEILDNISHETRTPIQGVLGMSSALVGSWQHMNEERRYSAISTIHESSKRLMSFVDNLVDLSKYKQGKAKFEFKQVSFRSILEEVLKEVELFYMPNRNVHLKVAIAAGVKDVILGDEYKLTQLLRNVIGNAFKYMDEGKLSISLSNQDDQLLLCVEDEGVGIPEAELEEIFEPFIQSSYTKTGAGGTGVGLTVARDIAVGHSGRIWAENRSPKGARFCIMLPIID